MIRIAICVLAFIGVSAVLTAAFTTMVPVVPGSSTPTVNSLDAALTQPVTPSTFTLQWSTSEELFNPFRARAHGNRVFVQDHEGDTPFLVYDTTGTFTQGIGGWGEGPGEFGHGRLSTVNDEYVLLSDFGRNRLLRYDASTLEYVNELYHPSTTLPPQPLGDRLVLAVETSDESILTGFPFDRASFSIDTDEESPIGRYADLPTVVDARKNYLLKQGPTIHDNDGNLYYALENASFIASFAPSGDVRFSTTAPLDIPLPDYVRHSARYTYTAPPRNYYPEVFIDLAVDDNWLYALYSGSTVSSGNPDSYRHLNQGTSVLLYARDTGKHVGRIELPVAARSISVLDGSMFILSIDPEISLSRYDFTMDQP